MENYQSQMNNQEMQETEGQQRERQPYEAPKATFVPLKLEERLLVCTSVFPVCALSPYSV